MNDVIIISLIIGALVFLGLIFRTQSKRNKIQPKDQRKFKHHWNNTVKELTSNPKQAVLEADKLLDEALKLKGFNGSLGEKMKQAGALFSDQNGIWSAHKLRNRIAHELNMNINEKEASNALFQFKKALSDLGIKL